MYKFAGKENVSFVHASYVCLTAHVYSKLYTVADQFNLFEYHRKRVYPSVGIDLIVNTLLK